MKNTEIWKTKGKAIDTNTSDILEYQSQSYRPIAWKLPNEEMRRHWTPTGAEPWSNGWMDGLNHLQKYASNCVWI